MAIFTRPIIRLAAVAVAFLLSMAQFPLFDCNKMPVLSVVGGTLTLLLVYATGEALYSVATSEQSTQGKLLIGACVALGGVGLVAVVGFFTLLSHICP